jgi:hypothetical protein
LTQSAGTKVQIKFQQTANKRTKKLRKPISKVVGSLTKKSSKYQAQTKKKVQEVKQIHNEETAHSFNAINEKPD